MPRFCFVLFLIVSLGPSQAFAKTVYDLLCESENHRVFADMLERAGLSEQLEKEGPFTVFAPTDKAFAKLSENELRLLMRPENRSALLGLLRYHIVPTRLTASDARRGAVMTLGGQPMNLTIDGGALAPTAAVPAYAERAATNGIVHLIDRVLTP